MTTDIDSTRQQVVVVTGGAVGIGRAIAEELGRSGAYVVTLDPGVGVDGKAPDASSPEQTTAQRIVAAGGQARASNTSVTDMAAVSALFQALVDEFGALDAVVNVAGISRPTEFASGAEQDWIDVVDVHLGGYLNVLRCALDHMSAAGTGRILGVTSGSGWRPANTGAYGCAKRAVASLTWQLGQVVPNGVTLNALSPIAATRMVTSALSQAPGKAASTSARSGGLDLSAMPQPEDLGPIGAYLASDRFGWASGNVIFSSGAECALVAGPELIEIARTSDTASLSHALSTVIPAVFVPAEAAQTAQGASNPRVRRPAFEEHGNSLVSEVGTCLIVSDDRERTATLTAALGARGVRCVTVGAGDGASSSEIATGFDAISAQVAAVDRGEGPIDAVVIALAATGPWIPDEAVEPWRRVLAEHDGITSDIRTDGAWYRAVADCSAAGDRQVRAVMLVDALTSGGRSRAQAAAQLSRSARTATSGRVDACTITVESSESADGEAAAELAAHLACGPDTASLSGAELVVGSGWVGLRSHPHPAATISFGGPSTPDWLDDVLRRVIER